MSINLKGIHLTATNLEELHEAGKKFVISKSWFSSQPSPHYQVISIHKIIEIEKYLEKHGR